MCGAERLAGLTGWSGRGMAGTDWARAEQELGIALPPDYRELAERFPSGTFQGYLDFQPGPKILADLVERPLGDLRRWRDKTFEDWEIREREYIEATEGRALPERRISYPFPLWPEPGGIYPWAQCVSGAVFFWLTGSDPFSWPVVWWHGEDILWEQFDGTATEFLMALVTGQLDVRRLGSPIFPPPPRFDPWKEHGLLPRPGPGVSC